MPVQGRNQNSPLCSGDYPRKKFGRITGKANHQNLQNSPWVSPVTFCPGGRFATAVIATLAVFLPGKEGFRPGAKKNRAYFAF